MEGLFSQGAGCWYELQSNKSNNSGELSTKSVALSWRSASLQDYNNPLGWSQLSPCRVLLQQIKTSLHDLNWSDCLQGWLSKASKQTSSWLWNSVAAIENSNAVHYFTNTTWQHLHHICISWWTLKWNVWIYVVKSIIWYKLHDPEQHLKPLHHNIAHNVLFDLSQFCMLHAILSFRIVCNLLYPIAL